MRENRGCELDRPVTEMTLWGLAQAIALFSDQATYFRNKPVETDKDESSNQAYATKCFEIRNACVAEIRDREQATVLTPEAGDGAGT